ncbi:MAG: hypothetical protein ACXAEN_25720, partial [Candidatus Thorarchaeota archaeon]
EMIISLEIERDNHNTYPTARVELESNSQYCRIRITDYDREVTVDLADLYAAVVSLVSRHGLDMAQ